MSKMNLPNKLTMLRLVLVPVVMAVLLLPMIPWQVAYSVGVVLLALTSLTDMLDGKIARKYNLITNFGKFMDPLADKLLVSAAMICLIELGRIPAYIVVIIISREFIISGFRLIASDNNIVIAASMWGKYKTVFQMVMVILMLANIPALQTVTTIVMWIATILTIVSLVDYVYKNKSVLSDFK